MITPQSESPHDVAAYVSRETSPLHDSGGWEPAPFLRAMAARRSPEAAILTGRRHEPQRSSISNPPAFLGSSCLGMMPQLPNIPSSSRGTARACCESGVKRPRVRTLGRAFVPFTPRTRALRYDRDVGHWREPASARTYATGPRSQKSPLGRTTPDNLRERRDSQPSVQAGSHTLNGSYRDSMKKNGDVASPNSAPS